MASEYPNNVHRIAIKGAVVHAFTNYGHCWLILEPHDDLPKIGSNIYDWPEHRRIHLGFICPTDDRQPKETT